MMVDGKTVFFLIGSKSKTDSYTSLNSEVAFKLNPCFAHAIAPHYAREGKLLPGAILPVLQYHANLNERLYPGRVLTVEQDSDCPSGVARPAKQPEFQLVLHQG